MGKILTFPNPVDKDGNALSAEQIDSLSNEAEYIRTEVVIGGKIVTFSVAVDFENIGAQEDRAYQKFKGKLLRSAQGAISKSDKAKNSKFTNLKEEEVDEESEGIAIMESMMELAPEQTQTMLSLLFPEGEFFDSVILGHDIPNVPQKGQELKEWFEKGTRNSRLVMESLIAAYDPTNPLVSMARAGRNMQTQMAGKTEEEILQMIEDNSTEAGKSDQQETLPLNSMSDPSLQLSPAPGAVATEAASSTCETVKPSSTGSLLHLPTNGPINREQILAASFPGGVSPSGLGKNTDVPETLELTSPATSGEDAPRS